MKDIRKTKIDNRIRIVSTNALKLPCLSYTVLNEKAAEVFPQLLSYLNRKEICDLSFPVIVEIRRLSSHILREIR